MWTIGVMLNVMVAVMQDIEDVAVLGTFAPSSLLSSALSWLPLQVRYPTCRSPDPPFIRFPSVSAAIGSSPP